MSEKKTFAERHPNLNTLIGLILLILICVGGVFLIKWIVWEIGKGWTVTIEFLKSFVNSTDKVIVVAMIMGSVSIIGVIISSIFAKIVEYRFNVKNICMIKEKNHTNNL